FERRIQRGSEAVQVALDRCAERGRLAREQQSVGTVDRSVKVDQGAAVTGASTAIVTAAKVHINVDESAAVAVAVAVAITIPIAVSVPITVSIAITVAATSAPG